MKRLFFINETDYLVSPSKEEAINLYKDYRDENDDSEIEVEEIPQSEWSSRTVVIGDEEDDTLMKISYAEYIEQFSDNETCVIASTEF